MFCRPLATLALSLLAATQVACVPAIGRQWDVQPVEGTVVDGHTGDPVPHASVVGKTNPTLKAVTDDSGVFFIAPQSRITLSLRMFGSYIDHQLWQVSHEDYAPALVVTSTFAPAYTEQPRSPAVPLFRELPPAPENCRFGPYVVRLYQWKRNRPLLAHYEQTPQPHVIPCDDARYRQLIKEEFVRLLETPGPEKF